MLRVLLFIVVVFLLGLGFAWLAERPGEMLITFGGYQYEVTLMVAAVIVTAIVAAVMIVWWLLKAIWNSPYTVARYFRVRRRDRGYQALSTGMIAAGAGDGVLARQMNRKASKLIRSDQEPLIHLLDAQASLLEGDHEAARSKFEAMLEDPETRLLGLRGLYLEAHRLGDREVARHYAERATETAPQLGWASNATLEARTAEGDWDSALSLVEAQKATRLIDSDKANRLRAVLLTAKAMPLIDKDTLAARNAAVEANRLAPDFVPAAVTAAKALFKQGDLRKGSKILETAWRKHAHPEIAEAYVHARHGDSVGDRLYRAQKLKSQRENNAESSLTVARAALEAGELTLARKAAEESLRIQPRESGYLLLADIEEADTGDEGRIRQWLTRAVRAPRDPAWVADGVVSERWAPVSPVTGRLDAFEWRTPVERPLAMIEQEADLDLPSRNIALIPPAPPAKPETTDTAEPAEKPVAPPPPAPVEKVAVVREPIVEPQAAASAAEPAPEPDREPHTQAAETRKQAANDDAAAREPESDSTFPRPDDPGVEREEDDASRSKRFRLF